MQAGGFFGKSFKFFEIRSSGNVRRKEQIITRTGK
jgi:hypothetical protein